MQKRPVDKFSDYLSEQKLKSTRQRDEILKAFVEAGRHMSLEELHARVKKGNPRIGFATVYRTMKLLAKAGIAEERHFEDGFTRYEYRGTEGHHDHLICTNCGRIIEFENKRIEQLQQEVARKNRFIVKSHKLELYGLCDRCAEKGSKS